MNSGTSLPANVLAITWEDHRRMSELCDWLGLPLTVLRSSNRGARRYAELTLASFRLLRNSRPAAVFLQNPSLILALLVLFARPFLGRYRVVMDAHNEAITPFTYDFWPITWLSRLAQRHADTTIVTNGALARLVRENGGRALVVPDRLPTPPVSTNRLSRPERLSVMVVATFAADEPIGAIFAAARQVGPDFAFAVTGNSRKLAPELRDSMPTNVRLTGFLPEHDYWKLMADCHVVLDLTLKADCLVCGAYEALSLNKPMILSGNGASRDLFGSFAVFPESCDENDIAASLRKALQDYDRILDLTEQGRPVFAERWLVAAQSLRAALT
jgi:glycosyltransferase involved in cell wall biosynthesis